ncbi:glycoside hydrolase family 10 protein [Brevibacillus dissolubilis]|uniref:glycoside hydrolase family 10 protein n=1 Tax=Brevibacillus dissolubilis TaxID=1844116 RepID=UPI00210016AE|nr:family 10 glycosylhydrolase [Brevibacillus dissolubilis]
MKKRSWQQLTSGTLALVFGTSLMTGSPVSAQNSTPAGQAPGKTALTANTPVTIPQETSYAKRQLRAAWIATVVNIDWPTKPGLAVEEQKRQYIAILDDMQRMGMNAVIVQVKPTSDAFYPSEYGPWSQYLTGVQGKDPGYDPLAFLIEEAHKRNLEFHAWFNPYRISMNDKLANLVPNHPARLHPDWVVSYGGKLYYNPGIPAAKDFVTNSILEVVKKYDIDAVHLDDYFYPYRVADVEFPDEATYQTYGAAQFANKDDWRRNNTDTFVYQLSTAIKQEKSYVKFGISPFGVWRNKAVDPTGSDTQAGQTNYDDLFADTRKWAQNEWIDYIAPQVYWNFGFAPAAYEKVTDWWMKQTEGKNIHLYIGQAAYKVNANNEQWAQPNELPNQLTYNLQFDRINGSMFFSAKDLRRNPLGVADRLANDIYKHPALVPAMPWLDNEAPKKPKLKTADPTTDGVLIEWEDHNKNDAAYFVVYRFDGDKVGNLQDATKLLTTVRNNGAEVQFFTDKTAVDGQAYTYVITAADRLHNESSESNSITLKVKKK